MRKLVLVAAALLAACGPADDGRFQGYVEGDFLRIAAPGGGRLELLSVERGAQVDAGAPLFALESARERAAVAEAEARHAAAQARLADLRKGKREEELAVIRAQLEQARAAQKLAKAQLKRQQELRARGLSSAEALDQALTQRERESARVRELEALLQTAELAARSDAIRAAEDEVAAAAAQLDQARWQLEQRSFVAPAAGLVEDVFFRPGEWVPGGVPVISLLPPQNRKLRFFVPETALAAVQPGRAVRVSCDGCEPFVATVSFVSPQAEFTPPVIYSREQRKRLVFLAEARVDPAQARQLRPGLPVDVELEQ